MKRRHKKRLIGDGLGEYGKRIIAQNFKELYKGKETKDHEREHKRL